MDGATDRFIDYVVTTTSGGCKQAHHTDFAEFAGRKVVVWPDNDEPGRKYAEAVCKIAKLSLDPDHAAKVLAEAGYLEKSTDGRNTRRERLPKDGLTRVHVIRMAEAEAVSHLYVRQAA